MTVDSGLGSKRILFFTTWYNRAEDNPNLINDLTMQLAQDGHRVTVVALEWDGPPSNEIEEYTESSGVEVILIPPRKGRGRSIIGKGTKFLASSFLAFGEMRRRLSGQSFDLMIAVAPLSNQLAPLLWAFCKFKGLQSYAYVTDFFPFHQRNVGVMPGGIVFKLAVLVETQLLRRFKVIGCMSPANAAYLRRNYRLRTDQLVQVIGLWGRTDLVQGIERNAVRTAYGLPLDRPIAVYGGQLSEGRGFEEIFEAVRLAKDQRPELFFLIIGRGVLQGKIKEFVARDGSNLILMDRVPRAEYLPLLAACDVGLICTVPNVDTPTFPSKTIDLLRAGVPVAASVESATDFGAFVQERGFGIAVEAGDASRLLRAIEDILDDPAAADAMRAAGRRTLPDAFDVSKTTKRLISQVFG